MKIASRWNVSGIIFVFLFTFVLADFNSSYAESTRRNPTKSGVKQRAKESAEKQVARWESLSPEQQEYLKKEAKVRAKSAEEYWNSLSAEEQQQAIERSKEGVGKARKKWQSLPE